MSSRPPPWYTQSLESAYVKRLDSLLVRPQHFSIIPVIDVLCIHNDQVWAILVAFRHLVKLMREAGLQETVNHFTDVMKLESFAGRRIPCQPAFLSGPFCPKEEGDSSMSSTQQSLSSLIVGAPHLSLADKLNDHGFDDDETWTVITAIRNCLKALHAQGMPEIAKQLTDVVRMRHTADHYTFEHHQQGSTHFCVETFYIKVEGETSLLFARTKKSVDEMLKHEGISVPTCVYRIFELKGKVIIL